MRLWSYLPSPLLTAPCCSLLRSVLVPHDAQCWRRLATIYGQTGQEGQAKQAHYTAWQLGIGQGGFGGPK